MNGDPTNDCEHTYTWNADNNPITVDTVGSCDQSGELCFTYDALGRMVEVVYSTGNTEYVYDPLGHRLALMNGQNLQKATFPLPGGGAAIYKLSGSTPTLTYFRHGDWLSSGRLASTPGRAMYYDVAYAPYGETYSGQAGSGGVPTVAFTGQSKDTTTDLYPFLFREYNSVQSRWVWPDPAGFDVVIMQEPQTWNRYAYVANSPLDTVDPLGFGGAAAGFDVYGSAKNPRGYQYDPFGFFPGALSTASGTQSWVPPGPGPNGDPAYLPGHWSSISWSGYTIIPSITQDDGQAETITRGRLNDILNHLRKCGGVYSLVAAVGGTFKIGSSPGHYAETGPTDSGNLFNGGNSTTTIDASNFANASPVTQTGVVVHEWFHAMQINNSYLFRFRVFTNRQSVENEANTAAKEAIQKCGPG